MSGFGYNVLGFGANASSAAGGASDDQFNRVSFLSHFDGANNGVNNAFDDGSASNHTITANGNVTQGSFGPFARPDGEWAFNNTASTNDSFKVTAHDNFDMTNPFTIEGWIFLSDVTANKLLFGRESNYWMTHDYQNIGGASGKFGFNYINSGSWGAINASAATVANTWYFLQATYVGTTVTFYINGVSQGTASVGSPASNTDKPFYVLSGPGEKHKGTASNVRLSSVARSTSLPTAKFTSDSDTELLVCQSNRFVDNGPDGHTITTTAGASVTAFGPFLTSAVYDPAVNGASVYIAAGDSDYLSMPAQTIPTGNFTVEGWYYLDGTQSNSTIIAQGSSGNAARTFVGIEAVGGVQSLRFQMGSSLVTPNFAAIPNQWTHFCATYNGSAMELFQNGVSGGTTSRSGDAENVAMVIGRLNTNWANSYGVKGYISDIRVSSVVRQSSNFTPPTAPLTNVDSNVKFLANMADGQAIDSAAQNNLTLFGNAKISTGQAKFGDASMVFDGTGDYVTLPSSSFKTFGTGDFTIECFARFDAINGKGLFQLGASYLPSAVTGPAVFASVATNNPWRIYYGTSDVDASVSPSADTWYHVAYVRSSGVTKLYVDGTSVISQNDTTDYTNTFFVIGGGYSSSFLMDGYIDEFRISHMARYTSNFTAPSVAFPDKGQ